MECDYTNLNHISLATEGMIIKGVYCNSIHQNESRFWMAFTHNNKFTKLLNKFFKEKHAQGISIKIKNNNIRCENQFIVWKWVWGFKSSKPMLTINLFMNIKVHAWKVSYDIL
jgi:hypothetical protein